MQENEFLLGSVQFGAWAFTYTHMEKSCDLHLRDEQIEIKKKQTFYPIYHKQCQWDLNPNAMTKMSHSI